MININIYESNYDKIHNYLCKQSLSPLKLWVQTPFMVRCTRLCDKVCQWLATCQWFSPSIPVSSTNKTDGHDITEILLKVALNTRKKQLTVLLFGFTCLMNKEMRRDLFEIKIISDLMWSFIIILQYLFSIENQV